MISLIGLIVTILFACTPFFIEWLREENIIK